MKTWYRSLPAGHWPLIPAALQPALDDVTNLLHQAFPAAKILRLDGWMKNNFNHTWLDRKSTLGHRFMASSHCHRDHRHAALHRQVKRTFLERQQFAVERALPFDVDDHVQPFLHHFPRGANGLDARLAVRTINRNERSQAHRPAEDGIAEQLLFNHDRRAPRNQRNQNRRIKIGNVIRHEYVTLRRIEFVESDGLHPHSSDADAAPCAPHEHAIEQANIAGDQCPGKADNARNRARCIAVTFSRLTISYDTCVLLPTFHLTSRSTPRRVRIFNTSISPGATCDNCSCAWLAGLPWTSRIVSSTCNPARSASLPTATEATDNGPSKLREALKPVSASVVVSCSTRSPTERRDSFHGISSVPATYLAKNSAKLPWLTACAAWSTPLESSKNLSCRAKLTFIHWNNSRSDARP